MNNEILLFSELYDSKIVEIVLSDFNIKKFELKELKNKNYKNKNILVFLNDDNNINDLKQISLNNFVLCFVNKKNIEETFNKATIMSGPVTLSKLKEFANKIYQSNSKEYRDVVIVDKKLTNKKNKKYTYFTDLENEIFSELLEKKELDKKYLKENILNIKNNIDTRSIESHFSRIRKKLSSIESSIKITSKGEVFFIN